MHRAALAGAGARVAQAEVRERAGDRAVGARVHRHADVRGLDLEVLRLGVEAGAPAHHAVALRVDREVPDVARHRAGELLPEALAAGAPLAAVLEEALHAERAESADGIHLHAHERVDVERVELRRAERHDARHELRIAHREHLREVAAAALADDGDALAGGLGEALEPLGEAIGRRVRAVDVRADAGALRVVPGAAQPLRHQAERVVAGEEARDQQHRLAAGVLDALTAVHAAAEQRGGFETETALAPQGREWEWRYG